MSRNARTKCKIIFYDVLKNNLFANFLSQYVNALPWLKPRREKCEDIHWVTSVVQNTLKDMTATLKPTYGQTSVTASSRSVIDPNLHP